MAVRIQSNGLLKCCFLNILIAASHLVWQILTPKMYTMYSILFFTSLISFIIFSTCDNYGRTSIAKAPAHLRAIVRALSPLGYYRKPRNDLKAERFP